MKKRLTLFLALFVVLISPPLHAQETTFSKIPEPLRAWQSWATWNDEASMSPTPYNNPNQHLGFWPSRLILEVNPSSGRFELALTVYHETWITLPGSQECWPLNVQANGAPVAVLERNALPSLKLKAGTYRINGTYRWDEMPQMLSLPREIGILSLTLNGKAVENPAWDAAGTLFFKQARSEEADKDFLSVNVYRVIEDGIPMLLHTEVELSVAGKSREENLGSVLPEGWQLSQVTSPIPVAVDDQGRMKVQVRPGKWLLQVESFRLNNLTEFRYAEGAKPLTSQELIAFQAKPDFRLSEVMGLPSVDVTQTTFPARWRDLPVYSWENATPFKVEERMRGMGLQKPEGLKITRTLWLDESGQGLTFRDRITGNMQQIWRLDVAENQVLGSVRSEGQGQLITLNPETGAPGIELRQRHLELEATGRMNQGLTQNLSATGWRSDADSVQVQLNLPPGWRLFALFGADYVQGDWLTAWSLLDLFLLLIFTLAVYQLWNIPAAILAFIAFGLAYHEPEAPRYIWLVLLVPLALLRVIPQGWPRHLLIVGKYLTVAALAILLIPFISTQLQQAIYPQLEANYANLVANADFSQNATTASAPMESSVEQSQTGSPDSPEAYDKSMRKKASILGLSSRGDYENKVANKKESNLLYDVNARIQTGPGVPEWTWRTVSFGWSGPVLATQHVQPLLIPQSLERVLTLLRIALLLALTALLLDLRGLSIKSVLFKGSKAASTLSLLVLGLIFFLSSPSAYAELPDQQMLNTLRDRLLETSDAYPNAADISQVSLTLREQRLTMDLQIHTALRTAVPLPGQLPSWSPLAVTVNGKPEAVLQRNDGYLWIVLPAGVHQVRVEGLLPSASEWEWSFPLSPRKVTIDAPGWNVSGLKPNGVPERQIFFVRQQKAATGEATYDRQDYRSLVSLERQIELGLIWQVTNQVQRLSPTGKALSLRIPLLPGEKVLSSNVTVKEGFVDVRLGALETSFQWQSELPITTQLTLQTGKDDTWVERWHLVASPVWNVSFTGLTPIFEAGENQLIPFWRPWPGEQVALNINRPEALSGATMTVQRARHEMNLGNRQRSSQLNLDLQSSLGEDFALGLPAEAQITNLSLQGVAIPVRKDGNNLIIPLRPGAQSLNVQWKVNQDLGFHTVADAITLPVPSANIATTMSVQENRWVLWADGPQRGPAVRFWTILAFSLLAAWVLGKVRFSPLRPHEWVLLVIGLTQVPLLASLAIIGWLFLLSWRGQASFQKLPAAAYDAMQVVLIVLTLVALGIFVVVVNAGLLGRPEMFILGNGSSSQLLMWYLDRAETLLPQPTCFTVSIWWYRFLMLAWALWLAAALIRWLKWGWNQFSIGPFFQSLTQKTNAVPPPLK